MGRRAGVSYDGLVLPVAVWVETVRRQSGHGWEKNHGQERADANEKQEHKDAFHGVESVWWWW